MVLTNLKTVLMKTVKVTSVTLAAPADRIGLGFGPATADANPTDSLSRGRFPAPHNPEPEQLRSRHGRSAEQLRKQMRTGTPDAVPPASLAGYLPPGSSADRVLWSLPVGASWSVATTAPSRTCSPKVCVRLRHDRDCQSPVRSDEKHTLRRATAPAATAGK
jgi:hypothetical protein